MPYTAQEPFEIRFEWGARGLAALAACRTVIVVDVLSFSTAVSVAVERRAIVWPYRWRDDSAAEFARARNAHLAGRRGEGYSLAPSSLLSLPEGARLVLPSPNGATLSLAAGEARTVVGGCLRDRSAVCAAVARLDPPIAVIAAGERWPDGSLRPALEDLLGAGAILERLPGARSPEAEAAVAAFAVHGSLPGRLLSALRSCASGRELVGRGFAADVELAAELDVAAVAPRLEDGAFRAWQGLAQVG